MLQIQTKIVSCHTADSKPVKQEVNGTVILPPFSIPCSNYHVTIVYQHDSGIERLQVIFRDNHFTRIIWSLPFNTDVYGHEWVQGRVEIVPDITDPATDEYRVSINLTLLISRQLSLIQLGLVQFSSAQIR